MIVMCFSILKALKADYAETQLKLNKNGFKETAESLLAADVSNKG